MARISASLGLIAGSVAAVLYASGLGSGSISVDDHLIFDGSPLLAAPFLLVIGVLLLTLVMHLARAIGHGHGRLAKNLLVAQTDAAA